MPPIVHLILFNISKQHFVLGITCCLDRVLYWLCHGSRNGTPIIIASTSQNCFNSWPSHTKGSNQTPILEESKNSCIQPSLIPNLLTKWLPRVTSWPPNHKNTRFLFYKHLVIINLMQNAEIFRIQILITKLRIEN